MATTFEDAARLQATVAGETRTTGTVSPFVKGHDGITVVHANNTHTRWLGFWVECECGWIGPSRKTEADAEQAHRDHVLATTTEKKG